VTSAEAPARDYADSNPDSVRARVDTIAPHSGADVAGTVGDVALIPRAVLLSLSALAID
jgi:hypothetical protein